MKKGRSQKRKKLVVPAACVGSRKSREPFFGFQSPAHIQGQLLSSCWRERGAFAVEFPLDLQWNNSGTWPLRLFAFVNAQCIGGSGKLTIFRNVSALAPCCW